MFMDSTASAYVFDYWPRPIILTGFEIGWEIRTGLRLMRMAGNSPVKDVFRISIPLAAEDSLGRMSWDETAVMIAVYGTPGFFSTVTGKMTVNSDGSNSWVNAPNGSHSYVVRTMEIDRISRFIEDRMMHIPLNRIVDL